MIYPDTFEQKIGFDRIREQVAAGCTMQVAREKLAAEGFSTSAREIERRLALADEMRTLGMTDVTMDRYGYVMGTIPCGRSLRPSGRLSRSSRRGARAAIRPFMPAAAGWRLSPRLCGASTRLSTTSAR